MNEDLRQELQRLVALPAEARSMEISAKSTEELRKLCVEGIMELSASEREELIKLCRDDGLKVGGLAQALRCLNKAEQSRG